MQPTTSFVPTILVLSLLWAVISALVLVASVREESREAAWVWAFYFVAASVIAAVFFWKLVRGEA